MAKNKPDMNQLFDSMWTQLWKTLWPYATDEVKAAYADAGEEFLVTNGVMYLTVPDCTRLCLEENMNIVKPILWPFMQRQGCSKLIYRIKG